MEARPPIPLPVAGTVTISGSVSERQENLPDLSGVHRQNLLYAFLTHVFNGAGATGYAERVLSLGFVRLVDKALEDYELTRCVFAGYINGPKKGHASVLIKASGHAENCLVSLNRGFRYARRLQSLSPFENYFEGVAAMSPVVQKRVKDLRDASEHMDERVVKGRVSEGNLVNLWLSEDALRLSGLAIEYNELAGWLTELQSVSQRVAMHGVAGALGVPP